MADLWSIDPGQLGGGRTSAVIATAVVAAGALATLDLPPPLLVWNASASMPRGLYRVSRGRDGGRGDVVIARLPVGAGEVAARRGYLPSGLPVVKRIAAVRGDRVCAVGAKVVVDGLAIAKRRRADSAGRQLPAWHGCRLLADEVLLLGEGPGSFDGRYFGPVRRERIVGTARLVWAR